MTLVVVNQLQARIHIASPAPLVAEVRFIVSELEVKLCGVTF